MAVIDYTWRFICYAKAMPCSLVVVAEKLGGRCAGVLLDSSRPGRWRHRNPMDDMVLAAIAQGWIWYVRFLPWTAGWVLIWVAADGSRSEMDGGTAMQFGKLLDRTRIGLGQTLFGTSLLLMLAAARNCSTGLLDLLAALAWICRSLGKNGCGVPTCIYQSCCLGCGPPILAVMERYGAWDRGRCGMPLDIGIGSHGGRIYCRRGVLLARAMMDLDRLLVARCSTVSSDGAARRRRWVGGRCLMWVDAGTWADACCRRQLMTDGEMGFNPFEFGVVEEGAAVDGDGRMWIWMWTT
ncbi:hypothetical protein ACLOJK_039168 [Asimina triloba]